MTVNGVTVSEALSLRDPEARRLGLDRLDEDRLILEFVRWAEGELKRWVDYKRGALLFVAVPNQPDLGTFYIYDRARSTFFIVEPEMSRCGGYREEEFEPLAQAYGLKGLAQYPRRLPLTH
jgi:hypothetical protein